jgi:proteasome accessory factor C
VSPQLTVEARVRRLLAVLGWLSRRGAGSAPIAEVAERFGMTEAEVVSELELAACCGLPPYSPDQLMELMVDDEEVQADLGPELSRPRRLSAAEGFQVAASARAILSVSGADPEGALARALAKLETVLGDHERVAVALDDPPLLEGVRSAAAASARLRISYYSASRDEASERIVDPYHVFSSAGFWYLDAWCHRSDALRHFRVDRIESAVGTGEHFDPPAGGPPTTVVAPGPDTPTATVLLPASARVLLDSLPTVGIEDQPDGRVRVVLPVGGEAWLARLLLRAGAGAEVLDPPELVGAEARAARAVLAAYG